MQRITSVDDYLKSVPEDVRAALNKLRKTIKAAAPKATEGISYMIPIFKYQGHPLVGFGAAKVPLFILCHEYQHDSQTGAHG